MWTRIEDGGYIQVSGVENINKQQKLLHGGCPKDHDDPTFTSLNSVVLSKPPVFDDMELVPKLKSGKDKNEWAATGECEKEIKNVVKQKNL